MANFRAPLQIQPSNDQLSFILLSPFSYWTGIGEGFGYEITVPAGFITDFASIPKFLWNIRPPMGLYGKAAVIHDWLYQNSGNVGKFTYDRKTCDNIFLQAMKDSEVPNYISYLLYHAVRHFGQSHFGEQLNEKS
jgi:hypothetical protein